MLQDNDEFYLFAKELKGQGYSMAKIEKELRLNNLDDTYIRAIRHKLAGMEHGGSRGLSRHFTPYAPLEQGDAPSKEENNITKQRKFTWRTVVMLIVLYTLIKALIRWILD
jgi:hypothetical protein